jgi:hypothetical protein
MGEDFPRDSRRHPLDDAYWDFLEAATRFLERNGPPPLAGTVARSISAVNRVDDAVDRDLTDVVSRRTRLSGVLGRWVSHATASALLLKLSCATA